VDKQRHRCGEYYTIFTYVESVKKMGVVPSPVSCDTGLEQMDYFAFLRLAMTSGAVWCQKAPLIPPAKLSAVGQLVQ